jgi:hypothetical protein
VTSQEDSGQTHDPGAIRRCSEAGIRPIFDSVLCDQVAIHENAKTHLAESGGYIIKRSLLLDNNRVDLTLSDRHFITPDWRTEIMPFPQDFNSVDGDEGKTPPLAPNEGDVCFSVTPTSKTILVFVFICTVCFAAHADASLTHCRIAKTMSARRPTERSWRRQPVPRVNPVT